jgi:hypothetical protein
MEITIIEHYEGAEEEFQVTVFTDHIVGRLEERARDHFETLKDQFVKGHPQDFPDGEGFDFYYESNGDLAFPDDPDSPGPVYDFIWNQTSGVMFKFDNGSEIARFIVIRGSCVTILKEMS